jgi:hypothetical protein
VIHRRRLGKRLARCGGALFVAGFSVKDIWPVAAAAALIPGMILVYFGSNYEIFGEAFLPRSIRDIIKKGKK